MPSYWALEIRPKAIFIGSHMYTTAFRPGKYVSYSRLRPFRGPYYAELSTYEEKEYLDGNDVIVQL